MRISDWSSDVCSSDLVADESGGDRMTGDEPHQQARRRTAVAHVEGFARLEQPADADALDAPFAVVAAFDRRPHRAPRSGRRAPIMPFAKPGAAAFPARATPPPHRAVRSALLPPLTHT